MLRRILSSLGPVMPRPPLREIIRASLGAGLGIAVCAALVALLALEVGSTAALVLAAPLGATTFLLFVVPNSPLAQPWSAVMGNTVSAATGYLVALLGLPLAPATALAVGGSVAAMTVIRAMHPPGAAFALLAVLGAESTLKIGPVFPLVPAALDTAALVLAAIVWNRLTGRVYPFRQAAATGTHGTQDPAPERRLLPSSDVLSALRDSMNLGANIGAEDLARILIAAETEAAIRRTSAQTCGEVMSRDLVTVGPDTRLGTVAGLFRKHNFRTLPVVAPDRTFLGLISQGDLIASVRADARRRHRGWWRGFVRMIGQDGASPLARDIMETGLPTVEAATPLGAVLPILADSGVQAAPVLDGKRLIGLVTRSDLIAVLARTAQGA